MPGSSARFVGKARVLPADEVFLDLEDAVAPAAKQDARQTVAAALNAGGWGDKIRAVRVNDATTQWAYRDVIDVVETAGRNLDVVVLPKGYELVGSQSPGIVSTDADGRVRISFLNDRDDQLPVKIIGRKLP